MTKKLSSFLVLFYLLALPLFGAVRTIIESDNIYEIEKYRTDETLIFFDLDDVIFTSEDYLGHSEWFYSSVQEQTKGGLSWENATDFMSRLDYEVKKTLPVKALDSRIANLVQTWQKSNFVLALTSRSPHLNTITFRMLKDVGVDFADEEALASPMEQQYSRRSKIERNIIFVSDFHSKGEIANRYINTLLNKPKRIIFIDDKEKYLHELIEAIPDDIEFIGIRYSKEDARKAEFHRRSQDRLKNHI